MFRKEVLSVFSSMLAGLLFFLLSCQVTVSPSGSSTQYTITASVGTGGSISPSGNVVVSQGSSQSFTITPNTGYQINNVTVDGVNQGSITSYTFNNVQANHTISVTFLPSEFRRLYHNGERRHRRLDQSIRQRGCESGIKSELHNNTQYRISDKQYNG